MSANKLTYIPLGGQVRGYGKEVFLREHLVPVAAQIEIDADKNKYDAHQIFEALKSLRSGSLKPNVQTNVSTPEKRLTFKGGYFAFAEKSNGNVFVEDIRYYPMEEGMSSGMYLVSPTKRKAREPIKITETNWVETKHAAVSGFAGGKEDAVKAMLPIIAQGYPEDAAKFKAQQFEPFTLFYNPRKGFLADSWSNLKDRLASKGLGSGTDTAKLLAATIEKAGREGWEVNWTTHTSGVSLFTQALKILADKGVNVDSEQFLAHAKQQRLQQRGVEELSAKERVANKAANEEKLAAGRKHLDGLAKPKQAVFFGNATADVNLADKLRRQVGLMAAPGGSHTVNPNSIRQNFVSFNFIHEKALMRRRCLAEAELPKEQWSQEKWSMLKGIGGKSLQAGKAGAKYGIAAGAVAVMSNNPVALKMLTEATGQALSNYQTAVSWAGGALVLGLAFTTVVKTKEFAEGFGNAVRSLDMEAMDRVPYDSKNPAATKRHMADYRAAKALKS